MLKKPGGFPLPHIGLRLFRREELATLKLRDGAFDDLMGILVGLGLEGLVDEHFLVWSERYGHSHLLP